MISCPSRSHLCAPAARATASGNGTARRTSWVTPPASTRLARCAWAFERGFAAAHMSLFSQVAMALSLPPGRRRALDELSCITMRRRNLYRGLRPLGDGQVLVTKERGLEPAGFQGSPPGLTPSKAGGPHGGSVGDAEERPRGVRRGVSLRVRAPWVSPGRGVRPRSRPGPPRRRRGTASRVRARGLRRGGSLHL